MTDKILLVHPGGNTHAGTIEQFSPLDKWWGAGWGLLCPGCFEKVYLSPMDGWRNDNGYTCYPTNTTHSQHVLPYLGATA